MVYENFMIFEVKEKVGCMVPANDWIIHSFVEFGKGNYYRVTTRSTPGYRAIGIIDQSILDQAIEDGKVVMLRTLKIKKKKVDKK